MQIVVAKYNEDISWTQKFKNVIIYDKGSTPIENSIRLPNVGREAHTYIYHIVNNYDNLSDYTCFVQGKPFDHSRRIVEKIENFKYDVGFLNLNDWILTYTIEHGCSAHVGGLPIKDRYYKLFKECEYIHKKDSLKFGAGAQFIVSKEYIHKRPKSFYEKLLKMTDYSKDAIEAWVFERFWPIFFCTPDLTNYHFIEHIE